MYPTEPLISADSVHDNYVKVAHAPNYCNAKVPVDTQLHVNNWKLYSSILNELDETLIPQIEYGFHMGIDHSFGFSIPVTNHPSAREQYQVIDDFIIKHYESGALLGPYSQNPFPVWAFPSPMQVVTSASGKTRPVIDMSYPKKASINDAIPKKWSDIQGFHGEFRLPTHEDICKAILQTDDPVMFITDLKSFYMQISSDWRDAPLMCITWRDALWVHRRLPFGCRSSCLHAQRITNAVVAIFTRTNNVHISGYVDDFASILRRLRSAIAYAAFHKLLDELGLLKTLEKCQFPDKIRVFLGLLYNLIDYTLTLPDDKLSRALDFLSKWKVKKTCNKHDVQVLLGHLNHFASVLHAGKPFTAFILDLLRSDDFPADVDSDLRGDIEMWIGFLQSDFRKTSIIKAFDLAVPDEIVTIAVRGQTCIVSCRGNVSSYKLHISVPHMSPPDMHVIAVWLVTMKHCDELRDLVIRVAVPTKAAADAINRAKVNSVAIRPLLRVMWLCQARHDFVIKADKQKYCNAQVLYAKFRDFEEVKLPS